MLTNLAALWAVLGALGAILSLVVGVVAWSDSQFKIVVGCVIVGVACLNITVVCASLAG